MFENVWRLVLVATVGVLDDVSSWLEAPVLYWTLGRLQSQQLGWLHSAKLRWTYAGKTHRLVLTLKAICKKETL